MLHELLFVLMGYSGDVFIPYPPLPNKSNTFCIPSDFPLLHPTERECLNRLGQLGWTYSQINQFTKDVKESRSINKTNRSSNIPHGAYALALVTSIEKTLNEYRQNILDMETRILNKEDEAGSNVIPLSLLTANLSKWEILLPSLWKLTQTLQESPQTYHGCKLFDLLMDQARTGVSEFRYEIEKMMVQLHNVLYRQLTAWMVYGQWTDPNDEFFIVPYRARADSNPLAAGTGWNRLYVIAYERIPSYLSHALVESILFVGKSIATVNEMNKLTLSVTKQEESVKPLRLSNQNQKINIPEDMKKKHLQLLLALHNSNTLNFNTSPSPWIRYPQELKKIVGEVRRSTADWLFSQVLIGDHGLHKYLNSFRHLFLLNYGDLAANFINQCTLWRKRSLTRPANVINRSKSNGSSKSNRSSGDITPRASPSAQRGLSKTALIFRHQELNALLGKASVGTEAEDQLTGYTLLLDDEQTKDYPFSDLLLMDLRIVLTYDLEWPIDLFLSESDLKKYSNLWSFLISVKNTQMLLNNLWKTLRTGNSNTSNINTSIATRHHESTIQQFEQDDNDDDYQELLVWRLRSLMLFWIDTVWNHIQVSIELLTYILRNTKIV